ncbi:MAG: hypothetical protein AUH85_05820 [Chloroflexi bacterium 13_1_40CM_4_68_4]|nr:MAG: hypothetical protein AUH85_05820 [Chloroflexi bacterium 13_1_40CM_4_68_4]
MGFAMERQGGTVLGLILIAVGVVFLIGQFANIDVGHYGWPFLVIIPGVVLLIAGIDGGPLRAQGSLPLRPTAGLVIPGMIVTTTGLVLLYQNATDHWESWAYAWALVGPAASGVGVALMGVLRGSDTQIRRGLNTAGVGLALFVGFAAVGTSGRSRRSAFLWSWSLWACSCSSDGCARQRPRLSPPR